MTLPHAPADGDAWRELRCTPREDVVVTDLGDQLVLLDPRNQEMYALDQVGRFIWNTLPGATLGSTATALTVRFGVDPGTAERDLHDLVSELVQVGVVSVQHGAAPGA